jgi:hypothetical protein
MVYASNTVKPGQKPSYFVFLQVADDGTGIKLVSPPVRRATSEFSMTGMRLTPQQ